jgi:site-specific recombinase XerD
MNTATPLPQLLERWFTIRLIGHKRVSHNTVCSYRDTFHLLLVFAKKYLRKAPSELMLSDINTELVSKFLNDLEETRVVSARTRNLRLSAIHSFFHFLAYEAPGHSAQIQRVLVIPSKRHTQRQIHFLSRPEIEALLTSPDRTTWIGHRDYTLLFLALQTGLRLSELISLERKSLALENSPHVQCIGKGRKERSTPLTKPAVKIIRTWLSALPDATDSVLFPTIHGNRLSADSVQYLVKKYTAIAAIECPSIKKKHVTPHVLRHTAAMELLSAGVDTTVIAMWLGHESTQSTQIYLHAHMALKEAALAKVTPFSKQNDLHYKPSDILLNFLTSL